MKKTILLFVFFIFIVSWSIHPAAAICGLCKLALLHSAEGRRISKAFNQGILYLLAVPYLLGGLITFGLYSLRRHENQ